MQNRDAWQESKYVYWRDRLVASRNPAEVGIASRLITDLVANKYGENISSYARGRLLDLGCGKVPLFGAYRAYISENICVDWDASVHESDHVDVYCDLSGRLPFGDCEFDTIVLSDVLEHLPEPEVLWTEMSRLLRADGKILMNVPFFYWLHEHPHDYYRYTEYALRRFVGKSGLELVKLEVIGGAPEILADVFAKNVVRLPVFGKWMAMLSQSLTGLFGRTGIGRKLRYATGKNFPLGYFLVASKPAAGREGIPSSPGCWVSRSKDF